jgi:hypothetical protein
MLSSRQNGHEYLRRDLRWLPWFVFTMATICGLGLVVTGVISHKYWIIAFGVVLACFMFSLGWMLKTSGNTE